MTELENNNVKHLNWSEEALSRWCEADWCWLNATFYSCPYCIMGMTEPVNNNVKYLNWCEEAFSWGYDAHWCWVNATFYSCPLLDNGHDRTGE